MTRTRRSLLAIGPLLVLALGTAPSAVRRPQSPSAGVQGPQDPAHRKAPVDISGQPGCSTVECHPKIAQGKFVHGPVAVQQCRVCHKQSDEKRHEFQPIANLAATCGSCHELTERTHWHKPVADGLCTACHDPHHSESQSLLTAASEKDLCAQCHEQSAKLNKRFVHGPVAAGACVLCHEPHSSYYPALLHKRKSDACLGCHTEMDRSLKEAKFWHRPVSEDCTQCHDAHASDHPYQLRDDAKDLCLDCHQAKKQEIQSATVFHKALTEKEGCKNCHKTHASRFPKLLDKPVMELCLGCHDKPQVRPDGSIVTAMGEKLANSKYLHGPIREGDCSGCHNPHGSKNFSLLREAYPRRFYAPFDLAKYNLCFSCHDSRVFTEKRTTTLTEFRNGDLNLHYVHVNKNTKGRTCRACHETHASNLPKHMAEKVPFGGWEIPINFEQHGRVRSCSPGCHKTRSYDPVEALPNFQPRNHEDKEDRK